MQYVTRVQNNKITSKQNKKKKLSQGAFHATEVWVIALKYSKWRAKYHLQRKTNYKKTDVKQTKSNKHTLHIFYTLFALRSFHCQQLCVYHTEPIWQAWQAGGKIKTKIIFALNFFIFTFC